MLEVAHIVHRYGGEYLNRYGDRMPVRHRRAMQDILTCRTPARGGHAFRCDRCGHGVWAYHSCHNRHCPKCHGRDTAQWLAKQEADLLPVGYFHLVFTVPWELRRIIRSHQKLLYGDLMKAAAEALMTLAADGHYVGGLIGVTAILHTWGRTLSYHPHVHCLVPGGGVDADGRWREARGGFLVPIGALSKIFRAKFRDAMAAKLPKVHVPRYIWRKSWVVHCKPALQGARTVLGYLGRYVHRVALANSRLLAIDDGQVTFRYRKSGESRWRTMTLEAMEFLRRFLQHVLPKGLHKVRHYGLCHWSQRQVLRRLQQQLADSPPLEAVGQPQDAGKVQPAPTPDPTSPRHPLDGQPCPACQDGTLVYVCRVGPEHWEPP